MHCAHFEHALKGVARRVHNFVIVVLAVLQSTRNTVPVPRHWCFKRKYLQGKRGIEKPPFDLPDFIKVKCVCVCGMFVYVCVCVYVCVRM